MRTAQRKQPFKVLLKRGKRLCILFFDFVEHLEGKGLCAIAFPLLLEFWIAAQICFDTKIKLIFTAFEVVSAASRRIPVLVFVII